MKLATPAMYKTYRKILDNKFVELKRSKDKLVIDRDAIFRLLERYSEELVQSKWNLDDLRILIKDDINRSDVFSLKLYKFNVNIDDSHSDIATLKDHLRSYIAEYVRIVRELANVNTEYNVYMNSKLRINEFSRILKDMNIAGTHDVLGKGYKYKLGTNLGELYIVLFDAKLSKTKRVKIDWAESMNTLKLLAKDTVEGAEILENYNMRLIKKLQFIEQMKAHTWTKNTPDKPKWIVYRNEDITPYWHWSRIKCTVKNNNVYSFTPTNFINNETRSQIQFTNTVKCREDIINSDALGCRDKMFALFRYDEEFALLIYDKDYEIDFKQ